MRLAYFPGCKISFYLKSYGQAVEAVMAALGVTLVKLPFNCCGNPHRGKNLTASVLSAMKNLALAQHHGLDILTPCKCCFGQLKHGRYWYETQENLREKIDRSLSEEGLGFKNKNLIQDIKTSRLQHRAVRIRHLLDFLYDDLGVQTLESRISDPLPPHKIALQQGCHALRPYSVTQFDNPFTPTIFRDLIKLTGLRPMAWSKETECCGSPAFETHRDLSLRMRHSKQASARKEGAKYISTACTHCQIQYGQVPGEQSRDVFAKKVIQAVPFAVFLGAALGIKGRAFESWKSAGE